MKKSIEIGWRLWSLIIGFFVLIAVMGVSYAYNSGTPSIMGHDASELSGVCMSNGTNCLELGDNYSCHWEKSWKTYPTEGADISEKTSCDIGVCQWKIDGTTCNPSSSACSADEVVIRTCGRITANNDEMLYCCG